LLTDSTKLGTIAVHRVCALDSITAVVTDDRNPGAVCDLQAAGVSLLCAASTSLMSLSPVG
jgi:DeoR family transcriptional regulator, fructose operon transcriptional repressor